MTPRYFEMAEPVCEVCGGAGVIPIDDLNVRECRCARKRAIRAYLGPELCAVPTPPGSPLFVHVPNEDPEDLTKKNLVIRGYWTDVMPHIKWALGALADRSAGTFPRYTILTDERLRTVYVGAESYGSRAKSKRDDMQTFNTLADIVGSDFDLVIIRLGHLGYKNVAMPGILKEALMLREVALKATWLIDSPQAPFTVGHFAYSEDGYEYIKNRFDVVEISHFDEGRDEGVAPQGYSEWAQRAAASAVEEISPGEESVPEGYGTDGGSDKARPSPGLATTLALSFPGEGKTKKKPYPKKKGRGGER